MELTKDYKQTDIGRIPKDWEVRKLIDLGDTFIGLTYSPSNVKPFGKLVLRSSNVQNGKLAFDNNVFVDMDLPSRVIVKENDLLICVRNGSKSLIGKCALIDKRTVGSAFGAFMAIFRSKFSAYIFQQFQSFIIQKQINEILGATINQITNKDLASFRIPFPLKEEEQKAIAEALSDVDELINSLEKLIDKKQKIKQGTMQQLLTGKKRLPGFNGMWGEVELKNLCSSITDGTHRTPKYVNDGIPFYSVENVEANNFSNTKHISLTEHIELIKRCKPEKGDILLTRIGTLGSTKLIDWNVDASIYVSLALLKIKETKVDGNFLYCYTKTYGFVNGLEKKALINAIPPKINMGDIGKIIIPLPSSKEEQKGIAKIVFDMISELEILQKKLKKIKSIKQGMMQELLTGKTRLV